MKLLIARVLLLNIDTLQFLFFQKSDKLYSRLFFFIFDRQKFQKNTQIQCFLDILQYLFISSTALMIPRAIKQEQHQIYSYPSQPSNQWSQPTYAHPNTLHSPSQALSPSPEINHIKQMIRTLDSSNRELLGVADAIRQTSIMQGNRNQFDLAIENIEDSMRNTLSEVIESIKEYFKDLDIKLKQLGNLIVQEEYQNKQTEARMGQIQQFRANPEKKHLSAHKDIPKSEQSKRYDFLAEKIKSLEISLKETQRNETKLITVIENLMEKYQVNDEPTLIRETPNLQDHFRKNRQESKITKSNAEFGTFDKNTKKSFYQGLYQIDQSVVGEDHHNMIRNNAGKNQFRLRQIEEDPSQQVYIKKLYSKTGSMDYGHHNSSLNNINKKSLKGNEPREYQQPERATVPKHGAIASKQGINSSANSDQQHRLKFMIGKLNL